MSENFDTDISGPLDEATTQQLIEELLERSVAAILVRVSPTNVISNMDVTLHWSGPNGTLAELVHYVEDGHSLTATIGSDLTDPEEDIVCQDQ